MRREVGGWIALAAVTAVVLAWVVAGTTQERPAPVLFVVTVACFTALGAGRLFTGWVAMVGVALVLLPLFRVGLAYGLLALVVWLAISGAVGWVLQHPRNLRAHTRVELEPVEREVMRSTFTPFMADAMESLEGFLVTNDFRPAPPIRRYNETDTFLVMYARGDIGAVMGTIPDRGEVALELFTTLQDRNGIVDTTAFGGGLPPCDRVLRQRIPEASPDELLAAHERALEAASALGARSDRCRSESITADAMLFLDENRALALEHPFSFGWGMRRWERTGRSAYDGPVWERPDFARRVAAIRGTA